MRTARRLVWAVLLLLATAGAAQAAAPPLTGTLHLASGRARTGGPLWVDLDVDNHTASLIEGRLRIVFRDGRAVLATYTGWDMALAGGQQRFHFMLPHPATYGDRQLLETQVAFVTERGAYDLGGQFLPVPGQAERACVVAVGSPDASSTGPPGLVRSLQLERYERDRSPDPRARLSTFPAVVPPEEFPDRPLGYCAYDIVVLPADAFALMHQRQLEALAAWVQAGGGICVLPGDATLKPHQEEFLKTLAGGAARGGGTGMYRCGLGRAVVAGLPDSFDTPQWRRAVGFLWRVHGDRLDAFVVGGQWDEPAPEVGAPQEDSQPLPTAAMRLSTSPRRTVGVQPLASAANFYQALMPGTVRLVPMSWIAGLLVLFVLAIGPGDYLLLGLIRRRKLTWLLFPALSVGFTVCMVLMARYYLGTNEQRAAYVFVDLGEGGRVLRTSRYELVYAATEYSGAIRYRDAIASALDPSEFVRTSPYYYSYNVPTQMSEPTPPAYAGRLPGDYVLRRRRQQWVPQLTRTLTIGGEGPDLGLHWDAVRVADLREGNGPRIMSALTGGNGFSGDLYLLNAGIAGATRELNSGNDGLSGSPAPVTGFLADVVGRPATGFFSVVSQVSPTGAGNFEDLSMLDLSDPSEWVLMAVQKVGDDYVICRRLYSGGT